MFRVERGEMEDVIAHEMMVVDVLVFRLHFFGWKERERNAGDWNV